jgi:hypothetical protein
MNFKKILLGSGGVIVLAASQLVPVYAASANISHSYHTKGDIPAGSLVSLVSSKGDFIESSNTTNAPRLVGVSVQNDDSLLAVDATNLTTQVANSGTVSALVSTVNGNIAVGDQVAVSPFSGVGMKADPGNRIVGLAQASFTNASTGAVGREVTDKKGNKQKITVGFIRVSIAIGTATANNTKLSGIQKLAQSIAGHPVSVARIILSAAVAVIALAALITLIYGAIFGSIIAVGRNPLAKFAIFRTLASVMFMAVATAALAMVTIYLMLK